MHIFKALLHLDYVNKCEEVEKNPRKRKRWRSHSMSSELLALSDKTFSRASRSSSSLINFRFISNSSMFGGEIFRDLANGSIKDILTILLPTAKSEATRGKVINHINRLIKIRYGTEVLPFGSVPLRTYLPHGDIDLTTFTPPNDEESTASGICSILRNQNQECAEFVIKDVHYVPAQVKIVKCVVQNIAVDISFNQVAGLSSLCFLEKADEYICKDHLFKRSIVLIKAWCFYESRILGAQFGLISTYALEVLVLIVINLFHSSLDSPVVVLDKFLEYYSTFDWKHHCISLNGPVCLESLPRIVAVTPESSRRDLLLKEDFYERHVKYFSVEREVKTGEGAFPKKHLNIIDPLKGSNNLGRSVRRDSFCRIISAFAHGSRKLKEILMLRRRDIGDCLKKFFSNTLQRNQRIPRVEISGTCILRGNYWKSFTDLIFGHMCCRRVGCSTVEPSYQISYFVSFLEQHLSQKVVSPRSTYSSTRTISQSDILMMYYSVMGHGHVVNVEETLPKRIGPMSSINTTFGNMSKLRATGTLIPYCAVQEKMTSSTCVHDMSFQERLKLHGSCTYEADMDIDGKSTSLGRGNQYFTLGKTKTSIPGIPVEDKSEPSQTFQTSINKSSYNCALTSGNEPDMDIDDKSTLLGRGNQFSELGRTNTYVPGFSVEDKSEPSQESQTSGKDTCSPDAQNSSTLMHETDGARDMELKHQVPPLQSPIVSEQQDVSSEPDKTDEKKSCFDLSMENFPLLPTMEGWKPFPCVKAESKTWLASLLSASPVVMKRFDNVASTPVQDAPTIAPEELTSPFENNDEMLVQPYRLEDDSDFPLLRR